MTAAPQRCPSPSPSPAPLQPAARAIPTAAFRFEVTAAGREALDRCLDARDYETRLLQIGAQARELEAAEREALERPPGQAQCPACSQLLAGDAFTYFLATLAAQRETLDVDRRYFAARIEQLARKQREALRDVPPIPLREALADDDDDLPF